MMAGRRRRLQNFSSGWFLRCDGESPISTRAARLAPGRLGAATTRVPHHDPPKDNSSAITGSVSDLGVVDQTSGAGGGYFRGLSVEVDKYVPYSGLRPPRDRARQTFEDVHQRNVANGNGQNAPGV